MHRSIRPRGVSLIELIVTSSIVVLLLGEVWMMMSVGSRFYLKTRAQTEVQTSALLGLRWLSKDLAEGSTFSLRQYDPDSTDFPSTHNGISFGSPKDNNEQVYYNDSGVLLWTSIVGYYIDPDSNVLYRTKLPLSPRVPAAPRIDDSVHHIDILAARTDRRRIAGHAIRLEAVQNARNVAVTLKCRNEELGFGLTLKTRLEMKNK